MGLFLCGLCDDHLTEDHVCDRAKIKAKIDRLEDQWRKEYNSLERVKNSVYILLQSLPSLDEKHVFIETKWVKDLWKAIDGSWYEANTADKFLSRWIALHMILTKSFDLFRTRPYDSLDKIKRLKQVCEEAKKTFGYEDIKFDLTPEEVLQEKKDV